MYNAVFPQLIWIFWLKNLQIISPASSVQGLIAISEDKYCSDSFKALEIVNTIN